MNYHLDQIPERITKPREKGLTMVMDKGLSLRQVEDFLETSAAHTDIVKLGWATSYVTPVFVTISASCLNSIFTYVYI
jgi:phosphosulfolactate synthase